MATPYISIIIPSYNSGHTIKKTVEGIQNLNNLDKVKELIIVDSSDEKESQDYLNSIDLPYYKLIISGVRVMPSKQRNIGAEAASGELLVFIDSDAFPDKDWITEIDKAYKSGYKVGGGSYLFPDFQAKMKNVVAEYYLQFNEYVPAGEPREKKMVPSCNLFCEKSLFEKAGRFPLIRASEDALFGVTVNEIEPMYFIPTAKVFHIFREDIQRFLNNQVMLGKYVFIYRKKHSASFMYKGPISVLTYPLIIGYKSMSIYMRMLKTGNGHFKNLNSAIFRFIQGMAYWSKGVWQGIVYSFSKKPEELLQEELEANV